MTSKELSDADVFGPSNGGELSDADVFGGPDFSNVRDGSSAVRNRPHRSAGFTGMPSPAGVADFIKNTLPNALIAPRAAVARVQHIGDDLAGMVVHPAARLVDAVHSAMSGQPQTGAADLIARDIAGGEARVARVAPNVARDHLGVGGQVASGVGSFVPDLLMMAATGGGSEAPEAGAMLGHAAEGLPELISRIAGGALKHSAKASALPATVAGYDAQKAVAEHGGNVMDRINAALANAGATVATNAAPLALAGRLPVRLATGAAMGPLLARGHAALTDPFMPAELHSQAPTHAEDASSAIITSLMAAMGQGATPREHFAGGSQAAETSLDASKPMRDRIDAVMQMAARGEHLDPERYGPDPIVAAAAEPARAPGSAETRTTGPSLQRVTQTTLPTTFHPATAPAATPRQGERAPEAGPERAPEPVAAADTAKPARTLDDALKMSEDQYIAAINPSGKRGDPAETAMMDEAGIDLPKETEHVAHVDGVEIRRDGTDLYAVVGGKVAGAIVDSNGETVNHVMPEFRGQGIGKVLAKEYIRADPFAQSGGMTEGGEAARRSAFRELQAEAAPPAPVDAERVRLQGEVERLRAESAAHGLKRPPDLKRGADDATREARAVKMREWVTEERRINREHKAADEALNGPRAPPEKEVPHLLPYLAKLGLNHDAFTAAGVDPASQQKIGLNWLLRKGDGGMTPDQLREQLQQDGYLPQDSPDGVAQVDANDALDLVHRALSGEKIYSEHNADAAAQMMRDREEAQGSMDDFTTSLDVHVPGVAEHDAPIANEVSGLAARAKAAGVDEFDIAPFTGESDAEWATRIEGEIASKEAANGPDNQADSADRPSDIRGQAEAAPQLSGNPETGLFGRATPREQADGLRRERDAKRDGKTGDGAPAFSGTPLGAGAAPEQVSLTHTEGQPPQEPPARTQDAAPEQPKPTTVTGISDARTTENRVARGLDELLYRDERTNDDISQEQAKVLKDDPLAGIKRVAEILANPKGPTSPEDQMLLMHDRARLEGTLADATDRVHEARRTGDTESEMAAARDKELLETHLNDNQVAGDIVGHVASRTFNARQAVEKNNYTDHAVLRRAEAANNDKPVPVKSKKKLTDDAAKLREIDRQISKRKRNAINERKSPVPKTQAEAAEAAFQAKVAKIRQIAEKAEIFVDPGCAG